MLTSPIFALSILLLAANDHIFKAAWPGLVTGKLSDVAGTAMIAMLLTAICGRVGVALASTAICFALLKTVPAVAEGAASGLGGVTRTDPSDVLALIVLVPLGWWLRSRPSTPRRDDVAGDLRRLVARVVLVTAAVLATTATSESEDGISTIDVYDGVLYASGGETFISTDGGATWQIWPADRYVDPAKLSPEGSVCPENICFQIDQAAARLTENIGRSETLVLELDEADVETIHKLSDGRNDVAPFGGVAAIEKEDGWHVVVAMGAAGALHRSPDGRWQWVAMGRWHAPDDASIFLGIPVAET